MQSHKHALRLTLQYGERQASVDYDQVIFATGFDYLAKIKNLLTENAREQIESMLGESLNLRACKERIGQDLSLDGISPKLHLPMLAGLMQGPGFSNLSCLGKLADRVLLNSRAAEAENHQEMPEERYERIHQVC